MATFLDGKHCIFCHVFVFVLVLNVIILWLGEIHKQTLDGILSFQFSFFIISTYVVLRL